MLVIGGMKINKVSCNENFLDSLFLKGWVGAVISPPTKSYLVEILFKSKG